MVNSRIKLGILSAKKCGNKVTKITPGIGVFLTVHGFVAF